MNKIKISDETSLLIRDLYSIGNKAETPEGTFTLVQEVEWDGASEKKYQWGMSVLLREEDQKHYSYVIQRPGSYHTDWYDINPNEIEGVKRSEK